LLILVAIFLFLFVPLVMQVVHIFKPNYAYDWLVSFLTVLAALPLVVVSRTETARAMALTRWKPEAYFTASPEFLLDPISWIFAVTLVTLCLAVIITAVAHRPQVSWRAWAGTMILTAIGLAAVMAGNPLTLILGWAALDVFEVWILFGWIRRSEMRTRFLTALSTRVLGIAFLIGAVIAARGGGEALTFAIIPASAAPYLLVAAGLRLGVLPMQPPFLQDHPFRRGLGTPLRLIPAAASLVLLVRAAEAQVSFELAPFLLALVAFSGIYSAVAWLTATSELSGRPFWILGMAALAFAAAVRMQPAACLTWGVVGILSGGALFFYSLRSKGTVPILLLGAIALVALPYTPGWLGLAVYIPVLDGGLPFFDMAMNLVLLVTHLGLVLGFIRHALRSVETQPGMERWVWFFYPLGLGALIAMEYYLGWQMWTLWKERPGELWWVGGIVMVLAIGTYVTLKRSGRFAPLMRLTKGMVTRGTSVWVRILSLEWFYRLIWILYHGISRIIHWVTTILEGDGGILWALVFLFLIISLSLQGGLPR
jgi:hypothetical protein